MTKTLQKKFIITAMAAITILLLVLLGAINSVNYLLSGQQTDRMLTMLSENGGGFPPEPRHEEKEGSPFFPPGVDRNDAMSARYFVVRMDASGTILHTDISQTISITEDEAAAYAGEAAASGSISGTISQFKYKIFDAPDKKDKIIVFLDTSAHLRSILTVLVISVSIGLVCWVLMLLLVILLSKKAIRPIARSMEKQKQFVTNAGHEIKTPLAIILANTDALELHSGESKWSRNIRAQTVRLSGLMENLLTLSKMDEAVQKPASTDFSMSRLLEEALHPFYESAAQKGITIECEIQPDLMFHGSQENLTQLVTILLDNAVKYANSGGQINVLLEKTERVLSFQVKNTCTVLPKDNPEKLFDRFYRGDAARTQKSGGYGIGLSVARAIAEAHKGTIRAEYEGETAILFTVKL